MVAHEQSTRRKHGIDMAHPYSRTMKRSLEGSGNLSMGDRVNNSMKAIIEAAKKKGDKNNEDKKTFEHTEARPHSVFGDYMNDIPKDWPPGYSKSKAQSEYGKTYKGVGDNHGDKLTHSDWKYMAWHDYWQQQKKREKEQKEREAKAAAAQKAKATQKALQEQIERRKQEEAADYTGIFLAVGTIAAIGAITWWYLSE